MLSSPEAFLSIEVSLELKLGVDLCLVLVLDPLCKDSLEDLGAVDLADDDVVVCEIIQPR